ncbi:MAG: glycosyltransferase family 2 protein [Spirochaetota bacterium]|nr:glycosyltransferase family 2 protein [Spirochaetota bacterium]
MSKSALISKQENLTSNSTIKKVLIIVPAYNEELNIANVIDDIRSQDINVDILVVNDSSKDRTSIVARERGVVTLDLPCNLGIGGAVQTGYIYAHEHNYDIAIQFDGDGQHKAEEIPCLLKALENNNADMVIGSRFLQSEGFKSSFLRRIGIIYFSNLIYLILKQRITDTTSGFRAVNKRLIKLFVDYYPDDYPEPEVLVYLHRKNVKIVEIPVTMKHREFGTSSIHMFRAVYYVIKVTLSILINLIRF